MSWVPSRTRPVTHQEQPSYPGGSNQAIYAYDAANRLSSVTDWNSQATSYAYDDANRMTTTTLPSGTGVVSSYSYDNANRLTAISHVKGGTTLASASYTLDNVGNRTQRVDQQGTHSYSYDDLYRLTSVTYPGPTTTSYAFDAFGNRTSKTDAAGTTAYAYDDADRITAVTPPSPASAISYTWDTNGNLTARGSDSFAWDYEDRMTSATVNSVTTTFAYRGDGLRDSRTTGGNTTTFTWDIAGGLPVVLDDGANYVYGAGLVSQISGANTYYYLADGLGSTMKTVDATGAVVNGYTYDIYGKKTSSTGSQANEFDFAGQQTDPTGLQYLRARYMDPETGTFLSRDPLQVMPSWASHSFGYSVANPVLLTDPSGLRPWEETWCGFESCSGRDPGSCAWENLGDCDLGAGIYPRGTDGYGGWFKEYRGQLQWCTIGWTGTYINPLCGPALGGGVSAFDKAIAQAAQACAMSVVPTLTIGSVIRKVMGGRTWVAVVSTCVANAVGTLWFPEESVTGHVQ